MPPNENIVPHGLRRPVAWTIDHIQLRQHSTFKWHQETASGSTNATVVSLVLSCQCDRWTNSDSLDQELKWTNSIFTLIQGKVLNQSGTVNNAHCCFCQCDVSFQASLAAGSSRLVQNAGVLQVFVTQNKQLNKLKQLCNLQFIF